MLLDNFIKIHIFKYRFRSYVIKLLIISCIIFIALKIITSLVMLYYAILWYCSHKFQLSNHLELQTSETIMEKNILTFMILCNKLCFLLVILYIYDEKSYNAIKRNCFIFWFTYIDSVKVISNVKIFTLYTSYVYLFTMFLQVNHGRI